MKRSKPLNLLELRERARRRLPRGLFEFVDRGTEDELALAANRTAFDAIQLIPRVLNDVSARSQRCELLGLPSEMPVAVAPTGAAGLLCFDGEIAIAKAARRAGIPFALSTSSIVSMERVAEHAGGRLWFQLYMWPDRAMSYRLVERARSAGYEALIITVDSAVTPNREYNTRNGFNLPLRVGRRNAWDVMLHPGWFFSVFARYLVRSGVPMLENYPEELRCRLTETAGAKRQIALPKSDSLTWDDLRDLRRKWSGRLLVKGVLHPEDAALAADCGVDGIIVSNHGGRNLDCAVAPILALPAIVDRVNGRAEVLLDSGIRRGTDVAKAMALGADGVLVGRAPLWGVASDGEQGVDTALTILRDEIDRAMALAGGTSLHGTAWTSSDARLMPWMSECTRPRRDVAAPVLRMAT